MRPTLISAIFASALCLSASPAPSAEVETEAQLTTFLDTLDARLESLDTARQLEFYYQLKGMPAPNLQAYQDLHRRFFSDRETAQVLDVWASRTQDSVLRRRIALYQNFYLDFLYDDFRLAKTDPVLVSSFTALQVRLNQEITAFKPLYQGKRVGRSAVTDVLRLEPDRDKRREAYLSGAEISKTLAPRMVELLRLTREMHRQMGFAGTVEGRLAGGGLDRAEVEALLSGLEAATRAPYRDMLRLARKDLKVDMIEAWDVNYWVERRAAYPPELFAREQALPRLKALVRGLGFKPDDLAITVENAGMANGGWNIPIRMGAEARLVVNPYEGKPYYDVLYHEYGHALNETLIRQDVGTFRTDRPGAWAEGMAETMAEFTRNPGWLADALKMSPQDIRRGAEAERWRRLARLRSLLFRNAFEYEAFTNPDQDLSKKYAELFQRYMLVPAPADSPWADDLFLIQPQVYIQNYVLASMIAAQAYHAMRRELGPELYGNLKVAAFLTDHFYRYGASKDWRELLKEATGSELKPDALLEDLGIKP